MTAVVSDIDWTAKTLTADVGAGDPIPGIPWVEPWSPDIEAFGAILPACKGWIFLPLSTNIISP
jgi:hypothetical protein